jgi:PPOX class probable F420-dependent enzyme
MSHGAALDIPETHRDLIDGPYPAVLSTLMPDGQPQVTPVWCNRQGDLILINTMRGFRKEKNMRANPHVSLLAYDARRPTHCIEIRGRVVAMSEDGARQHLDELTALYLGKPGAKFFGDSVAAELAARYTPVRVAIAPTRVRAEG